MKLPRSTQNWTTLVGATIALISLFMIVFLFVVSVFFGQGRAYLGLVIFILLPAVMIMGLLLIPIGMFLELRRERKRRRETVPPWPRIDLNDPRHRNAFLIFSAGTTILLFLSSVGSYEAYHYTDSITFCGETCHSVMHPEYTAYQHSPHARVACVGCHVGPGASWYVRSKLSGLYQVYSVTFDKYPRPIPIPIENLRPAREVCEQCHWPQKFYSQTVRLETHFLTDEDNTPWNILLLLKIGAQNQALGLSEGIHWHINPDVQIDYIASDETREHLPWVRYTNRRTGEVSIFQDPDNRLSDEQVAEAEVRTMDCIDCHNRPSHDYRAPTIFINQALASGEIPKELPNVKSVALDICAKEYPSLEEANAGIDDAMEKYYKGNYPDLYSAKADLVEKAVAGLKQEFSQNIFPYMKVRWSAYPNHIGHLEFNGCFRCHNGKHSSESGKTISRDCNLCHIISAQGTPGNMEAAQVEEALEFKHPEDIGEAWKDMLCTDCHTGLNP